MMRIMPAAVLALFAANSLAANPFTPADCKEKGGTVVNLSGVVSSKPASSTDSVDLAGCAEAMALGGLGADTPLMPVTCLRIDVSGTVKASGYSVLTSVGVVSLLGSPPATATTPFCFQELTRGCVPVPPATAGLQGFTSQAALSGRVQGNKYEGKVYTKDTGYITADGFVGQILLILGGTDSFERATGRVAVAGQEVGGSATYTGHICIAP